MLKEHKLKFTWLNPPLPPKRDRRRRKADQKPAKQPQLQPTPLQSFQDLRSRYGLADELVSNVLEQGFDVPTEVQLGAIPLLLDTSALHLDEAKDLDNPENGTVNGLDLLAIAPTGSGKTLAFLIPLLHRLREERSRDAGKDRNTSAIVLAPTRELASQTVNEGRKLARSTGLRITQMRKGMKFQADDLPHEANDPTGNHGASESTVKADIIVSTPGVLQSALFNTNNVQALEFVRHLVLDEADVLLDPLFRNQTLDIWKSLRNSSLRVSMWSATMGSNIEELARATIDGRRKLLSEQSGTTVMEVPLIRLVVGLKDSAVPNVQHKLTYAATEQGKLMGLRQLLHPAATSGDSETPLRPPFLVFTQTIERAVALHAELLYDIPAEAGGIGRIAVLHSDLSDTARDAVMTRFRKGEVWVLITTDLLSRGVDFCGVNGVVNYDIPTSSAAYVHRIGRTGRAGRSGGVAVTLYSKEDIPYLKHVANVVAMASRQGGKGTGMDQWLLDALPKLSKNEKQNLKKRGVESRTARGTQKDPRAARKSQISSKSGYDRRLENKRKGAIAGSRRAVQAGHESDEDRESDFEGFD
ncbi:RNA-dependent ATPase rok1 [Saxophila tyrrhenica]|uniref:ATP-dependent RNA helicase ROK1 n=1 Tax=Saxophila tyrrhenica TaxID=1690608 RepID=A0AAV9PD28_9PEZI|nr:RNA-dependent ATPase rok1 [Saxophila tyrrhenica]